jgi:hypothetical protein
VTTRRLPLKNWNLAMHMVHRVTHCANANPKSGAPKILVHYQRKFLSVSVRSLWSSRLVRALLTVARRRNFGMYILSELFHRRRMTFPRDRKRLIGNISVASNIQAERLRKSEKRDFQTRSGAWLRGGSRSGVTAQAP